jgi:hypothetical protein
MHSGQETEYKYGLLHCIKSNFGFHVSLSFHFSCGHIPGLCSVFQLCNFSTVHCGNLILGQIIVMKMAAHSCGNKVFPVCN